MKCCVGVLLLLSAAAFAEPFPECAATNSPTEPVYVPSAFPEARRFSATYSDFDFLDMLHMLPFYHGAQYLLNGPLAKEPAFLIGCTLF